MASPSSPYAGDLSAQDAWALLQSDPRAQLVDVRTQAEWNFVGLPDLGSVGKEAALIEWQMFPTMQVNPGFVAAAQGAVGAEKDAPVLFLCRSGVRSRAAAMALTE